MKPSVGVVAAAGFVEQALSLAQRLGLALTERDDPEPDFLLQFTNDRLQLLQSGDNVPGPIWVDFVAGKAAHRRQQGEGRRSPLARAVGFKSGFIPMVIDGTAGLGQDALVLATLGCQVTLVEQSPIIHALLEDGLRRGSESPETTDIIERMSLVHADAATYLRQLPDSARPDTIYLDPMYPHRGKKALSKKEMQTFQKLLGPDQQGEALLQTARETTLKRVVVKRPRKAPFLGDQMPAFQINGAKTRYDVYLSVLPADTF
jgi:16S rRNA (guanine1516-N2)-methyltransferase